jgi:hypothetical protein
MESGKGVYINCEFEFVGVQTRSRAKVIAELEHS